VSGTECEKRRKVEMGVMRVEWKKGNRFEEFLRLEVNGLFLLRLNVYGLAGDVVQECRYGGEQGHKGARVGRTEGGESQFRFFESLFSSTESFSAISREGNVRNEGNSFPCTVER